MKLYATGYFKIVTFIFLVLTAVVTLPRFSPIFYVDLPGPSGTYDCDDATLAMLDHFQGLGIEATPFIGNLAMDGEKYMESDHVWLLVRAGDAQIAYDWGIPRLDRQHYEGYPIDLARLLYAVNEDFTSRGESRLGAGR